MSGSSIPYHLRTNKAIERDIFIELLERLNVPIPIQKYHYTSLGGPMLEDLKILHQKLGMNNLSSIERDSATLSRQEFNKPFSCVCCKKNTISEYISDFSSAEPQIIWLDYVDTKWRSQFLDCYNLLNKINEYDILKLTLNANPDNLCGDSNSEKLRDFQGKAGGKYTSENLSENDILTMDRMAITLADIFDTLSQDALDLTENLTFHYLTLFRYNDSRHQMLTITGIILPKEKDPGDLILGTGLENWPHLSKNCTDIHEISVPDLTLKEKQAINQLLPCNTAQTIATKLPFKIYKGDNKNKRAIENYVKYYRYIPNFQRQVI